MKKETIALAVAFSIIAGSFVSTRIHFNEKQGSKAVQTMPDTLHSYISIHPVTDTTRSLITGYNYHLLKLFAADAGKEIDIRMAKGPREALDSLVAGVVDIVVMPFSDSVLRDPAHADSLDVAIPIDSSTVWIVRKGCAMNTRKAECWMSDHLGSKADSIDREKFFKVYSPYRSGRRKCLSPYDDIIKSYADTLGWDWRMLAAIIYAESHFHIEALSPRGAQGLMQLVPQTAKANGLENPLDPEENIAGGVRLLKKLSSRYTDIADNRTENFKYTLAAFNAGVGRVNDCINYALHRGKNPSYWANVRNVIPEMNDENIGDTGVVKLGKFTGVETINYVEQIVEIYNNFLRICPDSSVRTEYHEKDIDPGTVDNDDSGLPSMPE